MTLTTGPRERDVLVWLARHPEVLAPLPDPLFTPEGRQFRQELVVLAPELLPESSILDSDARQYLVRQGLACLGHASAKAQETGKTDQVVYWTSLVQDLETGVLSPVEGFHDIVLEARDVIPTGVDRLDEQILGLSTGELGIVFMPSGKGKTNLLINFATGALRLGKVVLYITVADQGKHELIPRIDTALIGTLLDPRSSIEILRQRHEEARRRMTGTLWVADFTDRECSLGAIEQAVRQYPADLVIVDHADDVTSPYSDDPTVTRHSLRLIYSNLKRLATRFQVPIWTASQSAEASWWLRRTSIADLAEAKIGKATGAAIVLGFSAGPLADAVEGQVWCTICKARRLVLKSLLSLNVDFHVSLVW